MYLSDAFSNLVSGLGTAKDKSSFGQFSFDRTKSKAEIEAMYRTSWLGGTIIDAPADDMTREWRIWHGGARQIKAIKDEESRHDLRGKVNKAIKMARLYGGSAILIGDGAADPSTPLNLDTLKRGGLKYIHVLSRWEIWAGMTCRDPLSEYFGEPEYYMLNAPETGADRIHPSRVVRFQGIPWLEQTYTFDGWGFSLFERIYDEIRNVTAACGNLASMTYEGKLDVIKIPNLTQNVSSADYRNKLLARFSLANLNKSTNNALILDSEEEWDQKQINLSNLPEGIRTLLEVVAGAANMPVTRLLGTSPKGLNATGTSELRNYYDMLAGKQQVELRPGIYRLDQAVVRSALGTFPDQCFFDWAPLWQMTEAEAATIATQKAQASQIYGTMGIMAPTAMREAIQAQLLRDGTYPDLQSMLDRHKAEKPEPLVTAQEETSTAINRPGATSRVAKADAMIFGDAVPRTLYVSRPVMNGPEILAWARKQGLQNLIPSSDLHVTIAYSREPVDWFRFYSAEPRLDIPPGGARLVESLGDKGAVVLLFANENLSWRWDHFISGGASWDHEGYQPHVTLSYDSRLTDLSKITAYDGRIVLGPERFDSIDQEWLSNVKARVASASSRSSRT